MKRDSNTPNLSILNKDNDIPNPKVDNNEGYVLKAPGVYRTENIFDVPVDFIEGVHYILPEVSKPLDVKTPTPRISLKNRFDKVTFTGEKSKGFDLHYAMNELYKIENNMGDNDKKTITGNDSTSVGYPTPKKETFVKDINAKTTKGNGLRFNHDKLRYDLVHPLAHEDMVKVLTYGANKYFDRNWENGLSWTSVVASLKRHIAAFEKGEDYDNETGLLHMAHAACNVHFLNTFYHTFPQGDDRVKSFMRMPRIGLDIDEVLCGYLPAWMEKYGFETFPHSWYFDREIKNRFNQMRDSGELDDFYLNMKPLIDGKDLPFEPHCYITSRPVSKEVTEKWLDMNGFPTKTVYTVDIMKSKADVAKEAGVEIFIDDSYDNFLDLNKKGVFCYLYTQKHNEKFDVGHMRLNSLKDLPFLK